jgi:hypothetical protein
MYSQPFTFSHYNLKCISFISQIRAICPAHLILLDPAILINDDDDDDDDNNNNNNMWAGVQIMKLLLCNFLQYPATFSLLGSHIFHSTLFPHTLSTFFPQCGRPNFESKHDSQH